MNILKNKNIIKAKSDMSLCTFVNNSAIFATLDNNWQVHTQMIKWNAFKHWYPIQCFTAHFRHALHHNYFIEFLNQTGCICQDFVTLPYLVN